MSPHLYTLISQFFFSLNAKNDDGDTDPIQVLDHFRQCLPSFHAERRGNPSDSQNVLLDLSQWPNVREMRGCIN